MRVQLEQLGKTYATQADPIHPPILEGIDLEIAPGESLAIVGPSGTGKSTLLNLIGTLDLPTSGAVRLDGRNTATMTPDELAGFRNRHIGFIFQLHHLLPHCTALENVLVPTLDPGARAKGPPDAPARAADLLARVGLERRADHRPHQLSGGERQRAAVARALINRPGLLLADEPTGSLDRRNAENLFDLLLELNRSEGVTLVVVTHALDLARRLDRTLALEDGKLLPIR